MAAVVVVSALAAASLTETVKKAIQQGIIEVRGTKPWWRGTVLRIVSAASGAGFGWLCLPSNPRLGLILGIGSGSVTAEVVGMVQRLLKRRNGQAPAPKDRGSVPRVAHTTDFCDTDKTEFRKALTKEDLER
jgi:hypothetical protein